jgi:hypothetical protein
MNHDEFMCAYEDMSLSRAALARRTFCTLLGEYIIYHITVVGTDWSSTTAMETTDRTMSGRYTALLEIFTECTPNKALRS